MAFFTIAKGSSYRPERLAAIDLKAGKMLGVAELPLTNSYLRDASADGKTLLSSSGIFFPKKHRFDLWSIGKKGELIHLKGAAVNDKLINARFVSEDRVALIDEKGVVSIWDTKSKPKALFKTQPISRLTTKIRVSSDRKHLFVGAPEKIFAINVEKGNCSGIIEHNAGWGSTFAIHPDQSQVAVASKQRIQVWDKEGQQSTDFYVPSARFSKLFWLDDRYLATGKTIIDTQSKIELCSIEMPGLHGLDSRGVYWGYDLHRRMLTTRKFNQEEFSELAPKNLHENRTLQPGSKVAIDIAVSMPAKDRKEVEENLKELLEARGLTVDQKSNTKIRCSETRTQEKREYRVGIGRQSATVTTRKQKMALVVDGEEVYFLTGSQGGSSMLLLQGGETAQEAANRQNKNVSYEFFKKFDLPKDIYQHPENKPFQNLKFSNL